MAGRGKGTAAETVISILDTIATALGIYAFFAAVGRLDKSLNPYKTYAKLRRHHFTLRESIVIGLQTLLAAFWITIMQSPAYPSKLYIPLYYVVAVLVPLTSQFFVPATPILLSLLTYYSARFIPASYRPPISVVILPKMEIVLFGDTLSNICERFPHPILDIMAWLPYGVLHFLLPFFVPFVLWLFRPVQALPPYSKAFGYMNIVGVFTQNLLPCAAPWYEQMYGMAPANYSIKGSPAGLARIDALFDSNSYDVAFTNVPVVFGAFPSLHAADAVLEALFLAHFFPQTKWWAWGYAFSLVWGSVYLSHHYVIDAVAGAALATAAFYIFLPDELWGEARFAPAGTTDLSRYRRLGNGTGAKGKNYKDVHSLEPPLPNYNEEAISSERKLSNIVRRHIQPFPKSNVVKSEAIISGSGGVVRN